MNEETKISFGEVECHHCHLTCQILKKCTLAYLSPKFLAQNATPYHDSEGCRSFSNLFKDQMCTWQFIWSEEANSCDLSMPRLWNSSLLMLYGKRNLFLLDCTSDSWQMALSLHVSRAETKSRTGFLPNLFKFACDVADGCFHRHDNRTRATAFFVLSNPCLICLAIALFQNCKNSLVAMISRDALWSWEALMHEYLLLLDPDMTTHAVVPKSG